MRPDDKCPTTSSNVESEVLAPPTAGTFERSMTTLVSYEHSISWIKLCNSSWEYDRKPSLENCGKIADFFGARYGQVRGQESEPISVEHRSVEYSRPHADGYPKIGSKLVLAM